MNILLIEDDKNLAHAVVEILKINHYNAEAVSDGLTGLEEALSNKYDAAIIDIMLPAKNGIEIVTEMRKQGVNTPVLLLTARTQTADKVEGLNAGADDYMTKPFEASELIARLRAITRRRGELMLDELVFHDLRLDLTTHELRTEEKGIHLSAKEFEVMRLLITSPQHLVSKSDLLAKVWGTSGPTTSNSVESYISFLRKKLIHIGSEVEITSLRMIGYHLELPEGVSTAH